MSEGALTALRTMDEREGISSHPAEDEDKEDSNVKETESTGPTGNLASWVLILRWANNIIDFPRLKQELQSLLAEHYVDED